MNSSTRSYKEHPQKVRVYLVCADGVPLARFTTTEPADWDDDMGLFHKNESSWCSGNVFKPCSREAVEVLVAEEWERLREIYEAPDKCPCMHFAFVLDSTGAQERP